MKKDRILLVEDDSTLSFIIEDALKREGFEVLTASNGERGLEMFQKDHPDLVIADVMMPKMDGFDMVRQIRRISSQVPVLFLTARTSIDDVVKGFELGANDYLRKPFQILELLVRIKALLRKLHNNNIEITTSAIGDTVLDFATQKLTIGKDKFDLSHIEAVILNELFCHPNEVIDAKTLMIRIWQNDDYSNQNRLHGFIYKIRKYLSKSNKLRLLNIRGIGYKLTVI